MKTVKIAIVQWLDAREYLEGTEVAMIGGGLPLVSVGILIKDEPDFVSYATDFGDDGYYRGITSIPRIYIQKIKIVRVSLSPPKPKHKRNNVKGNNLPNENPGPDTKTTTN